MGDGLLAFLTDMATELAKQEVGGVMKDNFLSGNNALSNIQQGNFGDAAMSMAKSTPEFKAYNTMSGDMSSGDKARELTPMLFGDKKQNELYSSALQLPQAQMPMAQMPSYARPTVPYQGGGIQEILARQQIGLLR